MKYWIRYFMNWMNSNINLMMANNITNAAPIGMKSCEARVVSIAIKSCDYHVTIIQQSLTHTAVYILSVIKDQLT